METHPSPNSTPGLKRGVCVKINHFPEDTDYDHDSAEYLLRTWRQHRAGRGGAVRGEPSANPSADAGFSVLPLARRCLARPLLSP